MATKPILHTIPGLHAQEAARHSTTRRESRVGTFLSRAWVRKSFFLAGDVVALVASHHLAEMLAERSMRVPASFLNPSYYYFFYAPFCIAMLYFAEGYRNPDLRRPEKELEVLFRGVSFSFIALACANFVLFKSMGFSRYLLIIWFVLALVFLLAARFSVRAFYSSLWRRGLARQKALLLGSPERLADFERHMAIQRYRGYTMAGVLVEPRGWSYFTPGEVVLPVLGSTNDWEKVAKAEGIQLIVVHLQESSDGDHARVLEIVRRCRQKNIQVEVHSHVFGPVDLRFERDEFSGCFRLESRRRWPVVVQRLVKAALDLMIGLAGSIATLLLIPFVAMLIKSEDGGPIFYSRDYIGKDGHVHRFLKFRTMVQNAEQILDSNPSLKARFDRTFKLEDDPRVLQCGRFLRRYSLDECPQFFSILTGQITSVGPRAITPEARERYGDLLPKLLSVKPGLTGFWQVMGRQTTTYEEKIKMDMFYIDHWSIWLDLVILAKTFWEVLSAEGAY